MEVHGFRDLLTEHRPLRKKGRWMAKEKVLYEVQGEWVWITLNYPERLNALDFEAYGLLRELLARYQADASLRVAILHGAGGRAFSTGSDMRSDGWVDMREGDGRRRESRSDLRSSP